MSADRLRVTVGGLELANPVIAGSGEHLIESSGVRAALAAGAGAVVVKSANESAAARRQLGHTDYAMFDSSWNRLEWDFSPPLDASLLNRSGLHPAQLDDWIDQTRTLVAEQGASHVIPSVIPGDPTLAADLVERVVTNTACSAIEVNIGAPHGREAAAGALTLEQDAARVRDLVAVLRAQVSVPLWIKINGQSDAVPELAAGAFAAGADAVSLVTRHMAMLPDLETQTPVLGTMAGFGGPWSLPITCRWLALTRARTGHEATLIGTNGARSGHDVARMMLAGASAVQLNSAVFTRGYHVITNAISELETYLTARSQMASDLVGRAADALMGYTDAPYDEDHWRSFVPPTDGGSAQP